MRARDESNLEDALSIGEMLRATLSDEVGVRRRATLGEARGGLVADNVAWVLLDLSLSDAPGLESVARLQQAAPTSRSLSWAGRARRGSPSRPCTRGAGLLLKGSLDAGLLGRGIRYCRVDMLKVDRFFVARLADGARQRRLFASVVGIAHTLGLRAVAEGVETREQRGGRSQRA